MDRSDMQLLLLVAILLIIYIDMRLSKMESRLLGREHFVPQQPSDAYNRQARDAYQQYVPTRAEQLAAMQSVQQPQQQGDWINTFNAPLWDPRPAAQMDMQQVKPFGSDQEYYYSAPSV